MTPPAEEAARRRSPSDFIFGKVIGEGSFSTVYLGRDVHTSREYAIKVLEKRHIIREKKAEYVTREKKILQLIGSSCKYFVHLYFTFQDTERLYFVLTYAQNGELLQQITKRTNFTLDCARYYTCELVLALEYLKQKGIAHRDLKPENVLFDENWHILITDFGSAKIVNENRQNEGDQRRRKHSFVGTAQYVSPEVLNDSESSCDSDLWALGCIVYQMIAGQMPFRGASEYLIFQKILKLEYEFPEGFDRSAKDLVEKLLVVEPQKRLGAQDEQPYASIRQHEFFCGEPTTATTTTSTTITPLAASDNNCGGPPPPPPPPMMMMVPIDWDNLGPPPKMADSPCDSGIKIETVSAIPDDLEPGLDEEKASRLHLGAMLALTPTTTSTGAAMAAPPQPARKKSDPNRKVTDLSEAEIEQRLQTQRSTIYDELVEGNLILKQGIIEKRKGLFPRRRLMFLTLGPHLYYVDPATLALKGEIPWSEELRTEARNFKKFFVHTPNRIYYLEDPDGYALEWCKAIEEVKAHYYPGAVSTARPLPQQPQQNQQQS